MLEGQEILQHGCTQHRQPDREDLALAAVDVFERAHLQSLHLFRSQIGLLVVECFVEIGALARPAVSAADLGFSVGVEEDVLRTDVAHLLPVLRLISLGGTEHEEQIPKLVLFELGSPASAVVDLLAEQVGVVFEGESEGAGIPAESLLGEVVVGGEQQVLVAEVGDVKCMFPRFANSAPSAPMVVCILRCLLSLMSVAFWKPGMVEVEHNFALLFLCLFVTHSCDWFYTDIFLLIYLSGCKFFELLSPPISLVILRIEFNCRFSIFKFKEESCKPLLITRRN